MKPRKLPLCAAVLIGGCAAPEHAPSITVDRSIVRADLDRDGRPDLLVRLAAESRAVNVTWDRADGAWRLYWYDSRPSGDDGAGLEVVRGADGSTFRLTSVGSARPTTRVSATPCASSTRCSRSISPRARAGGATTATATASTRTAALSTAPAWAGRGRS